MNNTTATATFTFADPTNVTWVVLLFLLGCGPTWWLILRAEYRWKKYRSPPLLYAHQRTSLDLWYLWARRSVTLNAGFYFMTALSLTPPDLFNAATTSLTLSTFVARDMLALKHIMHACFFWAGHANFWKHGSTHPLEICRAIFVLTAVASLVAVVTSWR